MDSEITKLALVVALLAGGLSVGLFMLVQKGRQRANKLGLAFELGTSKAAGVLGSAVDGLYGAAPLCGSRSHHLTNGPLR